jgi:rhodanese-related sulfurtransferase
MEADPKSKNTNAIMIGFVLIVIVSLFTFLRQSPDEVSNKTTNLIEDNDINKNYQNLLISDKELVKKLSEKDKPAVIDLRSPDEYKLEHIIDSINIPIENLDSGVGGLDKNKTYVLVDQINVSETMEFLAGYFSSQGFSRIKILNGGFLLWKQNNNPTIAFGNLSSIVDRAKVTFIEAVALKELIEKEKNLLILDVRPENEFKEGHLKDSINMSVDNIEKDYKKIGLGKKIIIYDNNGLLAFQAAVRLFDLGFVNTLCLSDGLDTWKKNGYEIVK